jgi:hypothetical protein
MQDLERVKHTVGQLISVAVLYDDAEKCVFNCFKVFENPNFGASYLEIEKKLAQGFVSPCHTCNIILTDLPPQARHDHILPGLFHNLLISEGQLCDNECSVTFTQDQVTVSTTEKM